MSAQNQPAKNHVCPHCRSVYRAALLRCSLDGSVLQPFTHDPLEGVEFADRYIIEKCIGTGGMGRVYRAKHRHVSRRFAIKILFGDLAADRTMRARFAREAEAASRLEHPNVASVVDFGSTSAGLLYLVMDYVPGRSLSEILHEEAPFPPQRAVDMARQLCLGLEHAHELGLIHRDFKPDNVIVTVRSGLEVPRIVDFGIALVEGFDDERSRLTNSGIFVGTPATIAPEQASGEPIDHRVDLYSLGITLYHMLAGRRPFDGPVIDILHKHILTPPPPMAEVAPNIPVPKELEQLCMRLLSKSPDDRPASAGIVARQLEQLALDPALLSTVREDSVTDAVTIDMRALHNDEVTEQAASSELIDDEATEASATAFAEPAARPSIPDPFAALGHAPPMPEQFTAAVLPMQRRRPTPLDNRLLWAATAVVAALIGLSLGLFVYSDDKAPAQNDKETATPASSPPAADEPRATDSRSPEPAPSVAPTDAPPTTTSTPEAGSSAQPPVAPDPTEESSDGPVPAGDGDDAPSEAREPSSDKPDAKASTKSRSSRRSNDKAASAPPTNEEFLALYREVGALIPKVREAAGDSAAAAIESSYKAISPNSAMRNDDKRVEAVKRLRQLRRRANKAIK